jgi:hypothetical protein
MNTITDEMNDVLTGGDTTPWLSEALRAALKCDPVVAANDAERLAHLLMAQVETEMIVEECGFTDDGDQPAEAALSRTRRNAEPWVECVHLAGAICGPCWIRARARQRQGMAIRAVQSSASAAQPSS